ncbi:BON domain-containing protein [Bdellovibrio bacteriovorus]|uniref:Pilus assembly protein n=1 Tax=Bdellovibrio bacteriovorus TaxID=959 RepID=A0A150WCW4_BDEBC|nr:BON domain-containing protein [Bdellovibrio bacteriovorus]KYG60730.1 pilus assembly protein [Bdellovibrio bacteriovorus]
MRRNILTAGLLLSLAVGPYTMAQEELVAEPSSAVADEGTGVYRSRKFINLTLGIEQDEKLPPLPDSIEFKGDFRRVVTAAYAKDLNVIRFSPKAEGFATLTIHDKRNGKVVAEFRIDVKKSKLDKVVREMRALLGDIEGINIKIVNNKVVVDGQILLPKDLARIFNVVKQFGDQASSLVTLSPLAQKKIAEFIARDINNPEIEVRAVNDKIILQGWANSDEEAKRAEIIAKTYLPDIVIDAAEDGGPIKKRRPLNDGVINLIQIKEAAPRPPAKMIQMVIHYVELNKDYSKAFKFQFTPELGDNSQMTFQTGGDSPGGVISSITGTVSNLLPKLNWAKQHGHARVLESTSLIVEDGKKGEIKQVTDQPYPVIGKDGTQGTAFASVGIVTAITPSLLGEKSGSVKMDMSFEVSSLLGNTPLGAPIVSKNQMSSTVTVRDRQSAAVGGLIRNSTSTGYNRPAGQKNPIISLYASKDFIKQQSQFVVFVTPIVKTSASSGAEQIKKKFRLRD